MLNSLKLKVCYDRLYQESNYCFLVLPNGRIHDDRQDDYFNLPQIDLIPGSFNPLHNGHKIIYESVDKTKYSLIAYEISINRVDKEDISFAELEKRLEQFAGHAPVVVSKAARFVEKIGLYKGIFGKMVNVTFHVGSDCVLRMKEDYELIGIQGLAANFIVHDRIINGVYTSVDTIKKTHGFVPNNVFRPNVKRDIDNLSLSSTQLRHNLT